MIFKTRNHEQIVSLKATSGVSPEEGMRLAHLAANVRHNGVIVEIGACWGRSASYIASAFQQAGRRGIRFYSVDLWDLGEGRTPERHHNPGAFRQYKTNLKKVGVWDLVKPVKADSLVAAEKFRKLRLKIDLLFIDGGHKYEEVLADYQAWGPFVRKNGVIVFHDYNHVDIQRMVDEYVAGSDSWTDFEIVERLFSGRRRK